MMAALTPEPPNENLEKRFSGEAIFCENSLVIGDLLVSAAESICVRFSLAKAS